MNVDIIKKELRENNTNANRIAKELQVSRQAVCQTIEGYVSRRIREAISLKIGKPVSEIWPDTHKNKIPRP